MEFERGYLGDDGNAKTLHIGTLDFHVSNETKPGSLGDLLGMKYNPQLCGDYM